MEKESNIINSILNEESVENETTSTITPEKTTSTLTHRKKTREQLARERRAARRLREAEESQNSDGNISSTTVTTDTADTTTTEQTIESTTASVKKTREQLARERRTQKLQQHGENRLDYVMGTRDTPEMTADEIAQKEAEKMAAMNQNGDPLDGVNNIIDKFEVIHNVWRILKKLAFVLLVLYAVSSFKGYRVKYIDGWSLAVVEKYNPDCEDANLITSPQYLLPENIALYAVNEKGKETLITASLIKAIKRNDGSLLYIAAPVGDHVHTFSVTQREFRSHHFYGFVKIRMNPVISFFFIQGITYLVKYLLFT